MQKDGGRCVGITIGTTCHRCHPSAASSPASLFAYSLSGFIKASEGSTAVKDDVPTGAALNRSLLGPTAPGEGVEAELDAFVSRRDKQRRRTEGERAEEAS